MLQISWTVNYPFKTNSRRAYLLLEKQDHIFRITSGKTCEYCKIFKKTYFKEQLLETAAQRYSLKKVFLEISQNS